MQPAMLVIICALVALLSGLKVIAGILAFIGISLGLIGDPGVEGRE